MKIKIIKTGKASAKDWDEAWENCDYATYSHSREWAEIFQVYTGNKLVPAPKLIVFSDSKKAVIPMSYESAPGQVVKTYYSTPESMYGGWISKDNLDLAHAKLLADHMLTKCGNMQWRINPFDENIYKTGIKPGAEETDALDLSLGFEGVSKRCSGACTNRVRKSQKSGITTRIGTTIEDWREYFKIYQDALARWGSNARTLREWRLFEEMFRRRSANIQLLLAEKDGKVIAGAIQLYARKHITAWHLATMKDYLVYSPANLLEYETAREGCQRGYRWMDFLPSGNLEGVRVFKKNFGPVTLPTRVIYTGTKTAEWCQKALDFFKGKNGQ